MDTSGWKPSASAIFHPQSAVLVLLAGVALALWSLSLDQRPMHNDEAVNGIKFGQLWEHGGYQYDHRYQDEHRVHVEYREIVPFQPGF